MIKYGALYLVCQIAMRTALRYNLFHQTEFEVWLGSAVAFVALVGFWKVLKGSLYARVD